jgi:hypothetical protein
VCKDWTIFSHLSDFLFVTKHSCFCLDISRPFERLFTYFGKNRHTYFGYFFHLIFFVWILTKLGFRVVFFINSSSHPAHKTANPCQLNFSSNLEITYRQRCSFLNQPF